MDKNKFQETIEEIKCKNPIEKVIIESGVQLKGEGNTLSGICPFHVTETYDSFRVNRIGQYFKCFNPNCAQKGDVITFVMLHEQCTFIEAVEFLAKRCNFEIKSDELYKIEHVNDITNQIRMDMVTYCQSHLTDEVKKYLVDRGITDNAIVDYSIGWCDGGLVNYLLQKYSLEDCIKAGVIKKDTNGKPVDFFKNRIIFPNIINGKIVHITGRNIDDTELKYLHIPGPIDYLYNESVLTKNKEVFLVEGVIDCLTLVQYNILACATYGTSMFKDEWRKKFQNIEKVVLCFDSDVNNAGKIGAIKIAEKMPEKCWIMELPLNNEKKVDVNSFFTSGHTVEEFLKLKKQPYVDLLLDNIKSDLQGKELLDNIRPVVKIVSSFNESLKQFYIEKLKNKFKISKEVLKKLIIEEKDLKKGTEKSEDNKIFVGTELIPFTPSQDFINGQLYYTLSLLGYSGKTSNYSINSSREFFSYIEKELFKRGLQFKEEWILLTHGRWNIKEDVENSLLQFVKGKVHIDVTEIYIEIESFFRKYVWYPNERYYKLLTLYVIGTYLFTIFDSFGYIFLIALKRSGKTRTLDIFDEITFNPWAAADITPASLTRTVESDSATLLIDEADKLSDELKKELIHILNAGYKRGGCVVKCVGDDNIPTKFSVYSPKIIASIKEVFHVLTDRGITLYLLRKDKNIKLSRFSKRKLAPIFQKIRNELYVLALTYTNEIAKIYDELESVEDITDREEEIWSPIFAIAKFIDKQLQQKDPNIPEENLLYPQMVELAKECGREKELRDSEEQLENIVVKTLWDIINSPNLCTCEKLKKENLYIASSLHEKITKVTGLQDWSKNKFGRFLRIQLHLIGEQDKVVKSINNENTLCYRITREKIMEVAKRLSIDLVDNEISNENEEVTDSEKNGVLKPNKPVKPNDFSDKEKIIKF